MIELRKLFTPVESMDAEKAKQYIAGHPEGTYTLLDVRQPWEYEEDHLPGAKLIPLGDHKDSLDEMDKDKPTLVYCAVGGRSRVAAQLMSGLGFPEVYNLAGGIKAYRGFKAGGPYELNLDLVRGDESVSDMLKLAFGLEKALGIFYQAMREVPGPRSPTPISGTARISTRGSQATSLASAQSRPSVRRRTR